MSERQYRDDLRNLPARFRGPVHAFKQDGEVPSDKDLLALLIGDYEYILATHLPEIARTHDFIVKYLPDFAYGSPELVARWEYMLKALNGRRDGDPGPGKREPIAC